MRNARTVIEPLAEAMAFGIDPTDVALPALPDEHPAPRSYRVEVDGQRVRGSNQVGTDRHTDDAQRTQVVRDARGTILVQCSNVSKEKEEKLARLIAAIPANVAEIAALRDRNTALGIITAKLEADCNQHHSLTTALFEVLKTALGRTKGDRETRIVAAAQLPIETDVNFQDLGCFLARVVCPCEELLKQYNARPQSGAKQSGGAPTLIFGGKADADIALSKDQHVTAGRGVNVPAEQFEKAAESNKPPTVALAKGTPALTQPKKYPWDYQEEPDLEEDRS